MHKLHRSTQYYGSDVPIVLSFTSQDGLDLMDGNLYFCLKHNESIIAELQTNAFTKTVETETTLKAEAIVDKSYASGINLPSQIHFYAKLITATGLELIDESYIGFFTLRSPG